MDRYLIATPHTEAECTAVINQVISAGFNTHVDWGCKDGEHTGWATIEAESREQAMLFVPPIMRPKAHVVKVVKFGEQGNPHYKKAKNL